MHTFWSLLAVAVFAFAVLSGGEPLSSSMSQKAAKGGHTHLVTLTDADKQHAFRNKYKPKPLQKKKSYNDDFKDLNT